MEAKKKKILICAYSAFLCTVLLGLIIKSEIHVSVSGAENIYEVKNEISILEDKICNMSSYINALKDSVPAQKEEKTKKYTVKETEGKIGIFSSDGRLIKLLPVAVEFLPETDRKLLFDGITLYDDESLASLIEDYTD